MNKQTAFKVLGVAMIALVASVPTNARAAAADECVGETGCFACSDEETGCIFVYCGGQGSIHCEPE